jgi:hypothetical protein
MAKGTGSAFAAPRRLASPAQARDALRAFMTAGLSPGPEALA